MGKHTKFSFSTEWRLGENFVVRPMECLTPTVKGATKSYQKIIFVPPQK